MRSIAIRFDVAAALIDAIRLFPTEAQVPAWAEEAREVFAAVGAAPYLRMLDEALAATGNSKPRAMAHEAVNKAATTA